LNEETEAWEFNKPINLVNELDKLQKNESKPLEIPPGEKWKTRFNYLVTVFKNKNLSVSESEEKALKKVNDEYEVFGSGQ